MTTAEQIAAFPAELAWWRDQLPRFSAEQLAEGASDDDWSIGQLYAHLAQGAMRFHLPMAQKALESTEPAGEPASFAGPMLAGQEMPPVKVPASPQYTPHQPAGAEAIAAMLTEMETAYLATAERVRANPTAGGTAAHMRFGHLTAAQWLALVTNHFRGHRKQLLRRQERMAVA